MQPFSRRKREYLGRPLSHFLSRRRGQKQETCFLTLLIKKGMGSAKPFCAFFLSRIYVIEVKLGHGGTRGVLLRRVVAPLQHKLAKALLLQWVVCMLKMSRGKRSRGYVKVTSLLSMNHNKSEQYVHLVDPQRAKMADFFFFPGIFCAFLRVALKDLHHTREAMSTAKSIRALSVHEIVQKMKLDSGKTHARTHTQSATSDETRETRLIENSHDAATPKNQLKDCKFLSHCWWKEEQATHIASVPFLKPYGVSGGSSRSPVGKQNPEQLLK